MSRERPILFSGETVRAILDGRKTQTRRLAIRDTSRLPDLLWGPKRPIAQGFKQKFYDLREARCRDEAMVLCPYGKPGDRLWVRETWGAVSPHEDPAPLRECKIEYRADLPAGSTDQPGQWPAADARGYDEAPKWRPSIHMPRWASRVTLEVTSVRVERLQGIDGYDCKAEGLRISECDCEPCRTTATMCPADQSGDILEYARLWDSLNAKRAPWASNPWVWVVSFKKL